MMCSVVVLVLITGAFLKVYGEEITERVFESIVEAVIALSTPNRNVPLSC